MKKKIAKATRKHLVYYSFCLAFCSDVNRNEENK